MAGINSEIDSLRQEIDRTDTSLKALYQDLGKVACTYHRAIAVHESDAVYEKICTLAGRRDDIEDNMKNIRMVLDRRNAAGQDILSTEKSIKDLDSDLKTALSALGAVAAEAQAAGRLPEDLVQYMEPVRIYNEKLAGLESKAGSGMFSSIYMRRAAKHRETLNFVFHEAGLAIYEAGRAADVPGQRAQELAGTIEEIAQRRKSFEGLMGEKRNDLSQVEGSLAGIGAPNGDISRLMRDYSFQVKDITDQLDSCFTEYGRIISATMDTWLDDMAPEELKLACRRLNSGLKRKRRQHLNLNYYDLAKEIEIHSMQARQLDSQIEALEAQRTALVRQIEELRIRRKQEDGVMAELREKQEEISRNAADIADVRG